MTPSSQSQQTKRRTMSTREFDAKYTRTLPLRITQAFHGTANEMSNTKRAGTPNLDFLEEKKQVFHLVLFGGAVLQGLVHRAPGKLPSGGTKVRHHQHTSHNGNLRRERAWMHTSAHEKKSRWRRRTSCRLVAGGKRYNRDKGGIRVKSTRKKITPSHTFSGHKQVLALVKAGEHKR